MKYIVSVFFILFLFTGVSAAEEDLLFSPKGVAEVHITLHNGLTLNDITREEDVAASMEIRNSENSTYDTADLYQGEILIKGRGNSTWGGEGRPGKEPDIPIIEPFKHKRSYSVDLVDSSGEDNPAPLLGMPEHHKWTLITFFSDKSLMRIPLAYYLGRNMNGFPYAPRIRYVEVFVNEEYRGLYGFCEKIERDKERVDIKKLTANPEDQVEPRISGGYIIEATPYDRIQAGEKSFKSSRNINFTFTYPKDKNITTEQIIWIKKYIDDFERVLYGSNYQNEQNGYRKYIHEDSFIDWSILQELSKNIDSQMYASVYIYKNRDGKLVMGPPWDYDITFGNIDYQNCYSEEGFRLRSSCNWFERLFQDPRFVKKTRDRYDELKPLFDQIPAVVEANRKFLEESGCVERNFEKFPILGTYIWPNYKPLPTSFKGEVQRLIEWSESRKTWLYINMGITEADCIERLQVSRPTIRIMQPEVFANQESSLTRVMKGYGRMYMTNKDFTYCWFLDGKLLREISVDSYTIKQAGKFTVQLKDNKGNRSLMSYPVAWGEEPVYQGDTGIPTRTASGIKVFPSPVKEYLSIDYPATGHFPLNIRILNLNGSQVKQFKRDITSGINHLDLDVSGLGNGLYTVQLGTHSEVNTLKIIVSHN